MLRPSSPSQKNLSDKDSSGSDAESEVSLEPETDRFGFILTNGSTAGLIEKQDSYLYDRGLHSFHTTSQEATVQKEETEPIAASQDHLWSVGPPPELVRQREAKWINIIHQWDRMLLKKTSKVKVQCQKGIPASLRAKCWPLLCGATDRMKQNENLYKSLDLEPGLQSWVDVIERDLDRQFPFHEMFLSKDGHGQRGLFRVLKAYTQYQPEEGYCQAQGPVAAVLLMNMPAEEAFWCLVQISEQYLPGYYSPLLEGVLFDAAILNWVLKRTCPAIHKHLKHHGVEPLMFATDWLMCLFTRHLPFNTLLRVWDLFFCYGVRVLLQVAVVLVRRVLGRAEQRKKSEGQMETLEKLRGVREQVQEEDNAFIAEVCSVPLSARDLEKRTEKELEKWKKDKPSSTFDPSGRCQGYQMAWARARQSMEEKDMKAREKGNLSVPIARSASTLSLSPSLLHKKWRKGGKGNTGEWEGGGKVMRHLSMGAKEDWRSWTELHFEKVQDVQEEEDAVLEEHKKLSEPELTEQTEEKELLEDKIQNIPTVQIQDTVIVKEQIEKVETITEKKEVELYSGQAEETSVEMEPRQGPSEDQTVENIIQPTEDTSQQQQEVEQDEEQKDHKGLDQKCEVEDTNEEVEKQVLEVSGNAGDAQENRKEIQKDVDADINTEEATQVTVDLMEEQMIEDNMKPEVGTVDKTVKQVDTECSETRSEMNPHTETESNTEEPTVKDPDLQTDTQTKQQPEVIIETYTSSQGDVFDVKYHSPESLAETEITETHTQREDVLAQNQENVDTQDELDAEIVQPDIDSDTKTQAETLILSSSEFIHQDTVANSEAEAEIPVAHEIVSSDAFAQCSPKECDTEACELTEGKEERIWTVHLKEQVDSDHRQAEEPSTDTTENDSIAPPQEEDVLNVTQKTEEETSSVEMNTPEEPPPEQLAGTENIQKKENTAGEDVFISTPNETDLHNNSIQQVRDFSQAEPCDSGLTQSSGNRSSRSVGDFCVRRSSTSRGSRLARRLSEDLFTTPQRISLSQSIQHRQSQPNPEALNPTEASPVVTQSSEITKPLSRHVPEGTPAQQEPAASSKSFGLFRRLRGKNATKKGTKKMQVPKILIQDFSDGVRKPSEDEGEEKLSSRERRRRRREEERRLKEEERLRKKEEKELEKESERQRRKPQTRGKSFQVQREKGSDSVPHFAKTGSQTLKYSATYAESYF